MVRSSQRSLDADRHRIDFRARKEKAVVVDIGAQPGRPVPRPYYSLESRHLRRWEASGDIEPVAADFVNHAVPNPEELESGLARLREAGLIEPAGGGLRFVCTAEALVTIEELAANATSIYDMWKDLEGRLGAVPWTPGEPLPHPDNSRSYPGFSAAVYKEAVEAYLKRMRRSDALTLRFPGRSAPVDRRPAELGYALSLFNEPLGVDSLGVPHEILAELSEAGLAFPMVADHPDTEIRSSVVYKDEPDLEMAGGSAAFAVMELMAALEASDYRRATEVLKEQPVLRQRDLPETAFPLLASLLSGDLEALRFLVDAGVGLDAEAGLGMTALHWAALLADPDAIEILLAAGADRGRMTWLLVTPAELARKNRRRDNERALMGGRSRAADVSVQETLRRMRQSEAPIPSARQL